jgi:hypothetical protein
MARAAVTWVADADADADAGVELPEEPHALDALMRSWATRLATRDLELAQLASQMSGGHLYRRLGYASFAQYARERMGLSPSALEQGDSAASGARPLRERAKHVVKARLTLAHRAYAMPEISEAVAAGRLGFEAAALVARVASCANAAAWVARAVTRTVKHLREEVEAATMMARVFGSRVVLGPPDEDTIEALRDVERSALEALCDADGQMSGGRAGEEPAHRAGGRMSGGRRLAMSLRDDVARFWRVGR